MSAKKIGIIGGGQLALMLAEAARTLGIHVSILVEAADLPASVAADQVFIGALTSPAADEFFSHIEVLLFESEFVDSNSLKAVRANYPHLKEFPALETMELFQDKFEQKKFLEASEIPTSPFAVIAEAGATPDQTEASIQKLLSGISQKVVLKWSRLGYDGKGVLVCDRTTPQETVRHFVTEGIARGGLIYQEAFVPYDFEAAIIGCKSATGEYTSYPVVISTQENGICFEVKGTAANFGVSSKIIKEAERVAGIIAEQGAIVGSFGVEFFIRGEDLFVNEIAPRVHNTGHYTLLASESSQFENHIRATCGLPLGSPASKPFFLMRNILGPSDLSERRISPIPESSEHAHTCWYGKKEVAAGRKMGHINCIAETSEELTKNRREIDEIERKWRAALS